MAEWLKALVLKTRDGNAGSNPVLSAKQNKKQRNARRFKQLEGNKN